MRSYSSLFTALQRRLPLFLLISLVAAVVAWVVTSRFEPQHRVHFSYLVSLAQRESPPEYTFDGFYALQATDLFTTTLASWVQTPDFIVEAYKVASLPLPTDDARRLTRTVTARKTAPQLVEVEVRAADAQQAEKLAVGLQEATKRRVAQYQEQGAPALHFNVVATPGWTSATRVAVVVITAGVFALTLALLINAYLLWESVRRASSD
jgi:capsular polysaccharide biosynthesis protein